MAKSSKIAKKKNGESQWLGGNNQMKSAAKQYRRRQRRACARRAAVALRHISGSVAAAYPAGQRRASIIGGIGANNGNAWPWRRNGMRRCGAQGGSAAAWLAEENERGEKLS